VIGDDGRIHVRSSGEQGSHQLAASALAGALAVLPDGDTIEAGAQVEALLLDLPGSSA
jgi:molybdopterin biosynthesis enzyme